MQNVLHTLNSFHTLFFLLLHIALGVLWKTENRGKNRNLRHIFIEIIGIDKVLASPGNK